MVFSPVYGDSCPGAVTTSCVPPSGSSFPLGDTLDMCTATDSAGNQSNCVFSVAVVDTTAPILTAALVPVGEVDDDEGRFRIEFSCDDSCDVDAIPTAVLNNIPVTNGQVIELELDDDNDVDWDDGVLQIEAPSIELEVTCQDASGNVGTATALPLFVSDD